MCLRVYDRGKQRQAEKEMKTLKEAERDVQRKTDSKGVRASRIDDR